MLAVGADADKSAGRPIGGLFQATGVDVQRKGEPLALITCIHSSSEVHVH